MVSSSYQYYSVMLVSIIIHTVLLSSPYMVRVSATVLVSVSCLIVCIHDMWTHKTCVVIACN